MKLSELSNRGTTSSSRQQGGQRQDPSFTEQLGVIRHATAYPRPIDATYQGQPVRLIACGDVVGMSPAVQIVDEQGKLDWVSSDEIQVTTRRFLPKSQRSQRRQQLASEQSRSFTRQHQNQ